MVTHFKQLLFFQQPFAVLLAFAISVSVLHPGLVLAVQSGRSIKTGPAIGDPIPLFQAMDQHGKTQDFQSIRGPKGALILFFRSADW